MEMSTHSSSKISSDSLEPQKKLSIKDRLGPIRGASSEDRQSTGNLHKSKRQSKEDSHEYGAGKGSWKEAISKKLAKDERLSSSRKSPSRKEKWLVKNRLIYISLVGTQLYTIPNRIYVENKIVNFSFLFRGSQDDKFSRRNRDKDINSECSPPPSKRSRDNSESRENSKRG